MAIHTIKPNAMNQSLDVVRCYPLWFQQNSNSEYSLSGILSRVQNAL